MKKSLFKTSFVPTQKIQEMLLWSDERGDTAEIIKNIRSGANPDYVGGPLRQAILYRKPASVEVLVKRGANLFYKGHPKLEIMITSLEDARASGHSLTSPWHTHLDLKFRKATAISPDDAYDAYGIIHSIFMTHAKTQDLPTLQWAAWCAFKKGEIKLLKELFNLGANPRISLLTFPKTMYETMEF